MRVLIAVNAHSRGGRDPLDPAIAVFESAGCSVQVERGRRSSDIGPIIERFASASDTVVLAGGDGTANAAAPALLNAGLPVGILPLGTANDLAATLGIPADLEAAAKIIMAGRTRRIDVGDVNGCPFFNVASLGLSVALTRNLSSRAKRRWGRLAYLLAGLKALPRLRPFEAEIIGASQTLRVRTIQIAVGNGRLYGGGAVVAEAAQVDDHCLDLYSLETDSLIRLALLYWAFRLGRQGEWPQVRTLRGRSFDIRTRRPQSIEADGKILARTPARFTVRPRALTVFAPVNSQKSGAERGSG